MKRMAGLLVAFVARVAIAQGAPTVNENTGDLTYTYPLPIPAARGRHQPAVALTYSSASNSNRGFGFGWDLTSTYIERDIRAAPTASSVDPLVFTLVRGQQRDVLLCSTAAGNAVTGDAAIAACPGWHTYVQRDPLSFAVRVLPGDSKWTVTDASGTRYEFQARCGQRWYLTRVVDLLGNDYIYRPSCDRGVQEILFDLKAGTSPASAWSNTANDGNYATRVVFEYGALTGLARGYENVSGWMALHDTLLSKVRVQGPGRVTLHLTELSYENGLRPKLASIVEKGKSEAAALRPTSFAYDSAETLTLGWPPYRLAHPVIAPAPPPNYLEIGIGFKDVDGDGRPDVVRGAGDYWARNITEPHSPQGTTAAFPTPQFESLQRIFPAESGGPFVDFNGDGILDRLKTNQNGTVLYVWLGSFATGQLSFAAPIAVDRAEIRELYASEWSDRLEPPDPDEDYAMETPNAIDGAHLLLQDVNGDGILDYAIANRDLGAELSPTTGWSIYLGYGHPGGFAFKWAGVTGALWGAPGAKWFVPTWSGRDLNGDGFVDAVLLYPESLPIDTGNLPTHPPVFPVYGGALMNTWQGVHRVRPPGVPLADLDVLENLDELLEYVFAPADLPRHQKDEVSASWFDCTEINPFDGGCSEWEWVPCPTTYVTHLGATRAVFRDANGDGIEDLIRDGTVAPPDRNGVISVDDIAPIVEYGTPVGRGGGVPLVLSPEVTGFRPASTVSLPYHGKECLPDVLGPRELRAGQLLDLNGDGILDYVYSAEGDPDTNFVQYGSFGGALEVARPALLRSVTTPLGAIHQIQYQNSRAYGARGNARAVVQMLSVGGLNVPASNTLYWYESDPRVFSLPYSHGRPDSR